MTTFSLPIAKAEPWSCRSSTAGCGPGPGGSSISASVVGAGREGRAETEPQPARILAAADLLDGRLAVERRPDGGAQQPSPAARQSSNPPLHPAKPCEKRGASRHRTRKSGMFSRSIDKDQARMRAASRSRLPPRCILSAARAPSLSPAAIASTIRRWSELMRAWNSPSVLAS